MAGQSHWAVPQWTAAKLRAGLTAELNGCDKAEQSQAVWAGEPSFFFFQRGPHKSWKLSYAAMKHSLVDWLICCLICWDWYYLRIFGDYDKPSDWESEITFHYEYGAYWGKLQLPNAQRWGIRSGQSAVWKIGYPKISRWSMFSDFPIRFWDILGYPIFDDYAVYHHISQNPFWDRHRGLSWRSAASQPPRNFLDSSPLVFSPLPLSCIGMGSNGVGQRQKHWVRHTNRPIRRFQTHSFSLTLWYWKRQLLLLLWFPIYDDWIGKKTGPLRNWRVWKWRQNQQNFQPHVI